METLREENVAYMKWPGLVACLLLVATGALSFVRWVSVYTGADTPPDFLVFELHPGVMTVSECEIDTTREGIQQSLEVYNRHGRNGSVGSLVLHAEPPKWQAIASFPWLIRGSSPQDCENSCQCGRGSKCLLVGVSKHVVILVLPLWIPFVSVAIPTLAGFWPRRRRLLMRSGLLLLVVCSPLVVESLFVSMWGPTYIGHKIGDLTVSIWIVLWFEIAFVACLRLIAKRLGPLSLAPGPLFRRRLFKWCGVGLCAVLLLASISLLTPGYAYSYAGSSFLVLLVEGTLDVGRSSGGPTGWDTLESVRWRPISASGLLTGYLKLPSITPWRVQLPLALPLLFAGTITLFLFKRDRPLGSGHCQACGHDLRGNISGVCSECGTPIPKERNVEMGADASHV